MLRLKLSILCICLFSGSCITERRCFTKYPLLRDTVSVVSVRDSLVYRDTTIYKFIPYKVDSIIVDSVNAYGKLENRYSRAYAFIRGRVLNLFLEQKEMIEPVLIDSMKTEYKFIYRNIVVTENKVIKKPSGFYKFCFGWFICSSLMGIIYVLSIIKKGILF